MPVMLIQVLVTLLVVGVLLWALDQFPAIDPVIRKVIRVVLVVVVLLWLISLLSGGFPVMRWR